MFKKDYMISGITLETANRWYKDTEGELKFYVDKKTNKAYFIRSLTVFGAMIMKIKLIKYNLTHPCVLKIKKYRV